MKRADRYTRLARLLGSDPGSALRPAISDEAWRGLLEIATGTLVAPALHPWLARAALLERLPAEVAEYLGTLTRLNARRNVLLREHAALLAQHCAQAGARPRLLKGLALLGAVYGEGERMLGDLDLLVSPDRVDAVRARLQADGYRELASAPGQSPSRHHLPALVHADRHGAVELHFDIVASDRGREALHQVVAGLPQAWHAASLGGVPVERPDATLHVGHRFVHDLSHEPGYLRAWLPLRGMLDVYRLSLGAPLDWALLERAAVAADLGAEWQAWRHALGRHFPTLAPVRTTLGARLWYLRLRAHQQWPALYALTRRLFQRLRGLMPQRWLRYWGW